jgi:adenylyl- and sulfurtransferase ThiI
MNSTQARERLADLSGEVAQASEEVTATREAVSAGEAIEKDVAKAQRALVKAQDRAEQARTDLRVTERREQAEAEATSREVARIKRELDAIARSKAAIEAEEYRKFLESVKATATTFNDRIGQYEQTLGYRSLIVPGRFTSYGLLFSALNDQLRHFTKPTNHGEAF